MTEPAGLTVASAGVNAATPRPCYAWGGVRLLAVLGAATAIVLGATIPYVRSRTDASGIDGGHCLGWLAGTLEFRENVLGAPGTGDVGFAAMDRALATW